MPGRTSFVVTEHFRTLRAANLPMQSILRKHRYTHMQSCGNLMGPTV